MNILQWEKGGKLWRKLGAWKAYMLREKEERRERISLEEKNEKLKDAYKWGSSLLK